MITLDDIKYATFRKSTIGGYRTDDVDTFIDDIQDSFKVLFKQNEDLAKRVSKLSSTIEKYENDEGILKHALLNAQKISEDSIKQAKDEAESLIRNAKLEAEDIIKESKIRNFSTTKQFDLLKTEVSVFKKKIINLYKEHLQLLDSLPTVDTRMYSENQIKGVSKTQKSETSNKESEDNFDDEISET